MMTSYWMIVTCVVTVLLPMVTAYPKGPPVGTVDKLCDTMMPQHGYGVRPQVPNEGNKPYQVTVTSPCYKPGSPVRVFVELLDWSKTYFEGLFVMARKWENGRLVNTSNIGNFTTDDHDLQLQSCYRKPGSAISHNGTAHWKCKKFKWWPPAGARDTVIFQATVVKNKTTYWVNVISQQLNYKPTCGDSDQEKDDMEEKWAMCNTGPDGSGHTDRPRPPRPSGSDVIRIGVITWLLSVTMAAIFSANL